MRRSAGVSPRAITRARHAYFVEEVAFGPGAWENELPAETQAVFVQNAPTYLDELQDPE